MVGSDAPGGRLPLRTPASTLAAMPALLDPVMVWRRRSVELIVLPQFYDPKSGPVPRLVCSWSDGIPFGVLQMRPSPRITVRRLPERGAYDRATVDAILDEALSCHVGFVVDGQPYVIPTIHAREGDKLYIHGSSASRMLRTLAAGTPVCVTVTIQDGLVLARSGFHHSMNYRSVLVLGTAVEVLDRGERLHALETISEHVIPGRWAEIRPPNERELAQTKILRMGLDEASAKVRSGGPKDDPADLSLPVWAGVLPLRLVTREAVTDDRVPEDVPVPGYVAHHRLGADRGTP